MGDVRLSVRGADVIDALEPLWLSLFDHHHSVGDAGLATIPREHSWPRRRRLYNELFEDTDTFVVLAERDDAPVGYAMCHLRRAPDDSWDTSDIIGEIETLAVLPDERGHGLGTALMDAAEAELHRRGAETMVTAVMAGNDRALEFYRARGMQPTVTYLMRLRPRD